MALAALAGVAVALRDDGGIEPDPSDPAGETADAGTDADGARIGTTIAGVDLQVGDCVDYDPGPGLRASYAIVACDEPHLAEVTELLDHPDAGGGYPGADALDRFAVGCDQATEAWLGADPYDTTLAVVPRLPDSTDWDAGMHRVVCLVANHDGSSLAASTAGDAASFPRGTEVPVGRLKLGDCFQPPGAADSTVPTDLVDVVDCAEPHQGFFFGRVTLDDFGRTAPYPGGDSIADAAVVACDEAFTLWFGVAAEDFPYRYWSPDELSWAEGDRGVLCAVLDEAGLPAELVFEVFRPVTDLEVGDCYLLPPDVAAADLGLDTPVEPVACREEHNGQIFGRGDLDAGTFPGDEALSFEVDSLCIRHFTQYVGVSPSVAYDGAYLYWAPTGEDWAAADRRYRCTFLDDDPTTGSREELSA